MHSALYFARQNQATPPALNHGLSLQAADSRGFSQAMTRNFRMQQALVKKRSGRGSKEAQEQHMTLPSRWQYNMGLICTKATKMRAIEITQPGAPDVLKLCDRPMPQPQTGEVLIKVHAAGINRPDVLQRTGNYPVPKGASDL